METGTGRTTLLFSHISKNHKVFTVNNKNSLAAVKDCFLFKSENVEIIEGPSQQNLPAHQFQYKLNAVLLDGPHAYPFPDVEYYCIYRHIAKDGIFIIDDIQIPSIYNLYRFLREEDMFEFIEVVDGKMAFFRRTGAPTFNPFGEGWNLQKYNLNKENVKSVKASLKKQSNVTCESPKLSKEVLAELAEKNRLLDEKENQLARKEKLLVENGIRLAEKDRNIKALMSSWSWKITVPLRAAYSILKRK